MVTGASLSESSMPARSEALAAQHRHYQFLLPIMSAAPLKLADTRPDKKRLSDMSRRFRYIDRVQTSSTRLQKMRSV